METLKISSLNTPQEVSDALSRMYAPGLANYVNDLVRAQAKKEPGKVHMETRFACKGRETILVAGVYALGTLSGFCFLANRRDPDVEEKLMQAAMESAAWAALDAMNLRGPHQ
jgi:hypothetical protein